MAAGFVGGSTQHLTNSAAPITDYPFTVGLWFRLTAVGAVARTLFALSDTGTTNNYLLIRMTSAEAVQHGGAAGGAEVVSTLSGTLVAGTWNFVMVRFLSSTNRRANTLLSTGIVNASNAASALAPTGMDTMKLGALQTSGGVSEPWDGAIGEYWLVNGDVTINTGAALSDAEVRTLAYGGPFSPANQNKNRIVEYRSFRRSIESREDQPYDVYGGINGSQTWTQTNGVSLTDHPPLPYWRRKPGDVSTMLMA